MNRKRIVAPPRRRSSKGSAPQADQVNGNLEKGGSDLVPLSLKVPRALRKEMNLFAAEHETTVTDLLKRGYQLVREEIQRGE